MNNTNQNHTDNFFKQGLSSPPEITPSEENWKAMERLLKPEAKRRAIGWIYITSGIAAALLIFLSLWLIPQKPVTSVSEVKAGKNEEPVVPAQVRTGVASSSGKKHILAEDSQLARKDFIRLEFAGKRLQLAGDQNQAINTSETSLEKSTRREPLNPARFLNVQGSLADKLVDNANMMITIVNNLGDTINHTNPEGVTTNNDSAPRSKDVSGKWALSMAMSPDLNSVAGVDKSAFGMSLGAGLSYRLGKAVSIGTGIYYSRKLYSADKTSYKVKQKPFATWTSYSNRIDADCRVIDIPVNLSFRVSNGKQNKLYATAGLSSYIMLSEKYDFIYNPSPAYPSGKREYTVRNQNEHILSVMNLGVALEKPLNSQMSLVIQPYAKIPLTGIGQGETDLKSFGVGFKLNYSLKKKL